MTIKSLFYSAENTPVDSTDIARFGNDAKFAKYMIYRKACMVLVLIFSILNVLSTGLYSFSLTDDVKRYYYIGMLSVEPFISLINVVFVGVALNHWTNIVKSNGMLNAAFWTSVFTLIGSKAVPMVFFGFDEIYNYEQLIYNMALKLDDITSVSYLVVVSITSTLLYCITLISNYFNDYSYNPITNIIKMINTFATVAVLVDIHQYIFPFYFPLTLDEYGIVIGTTQIVKYALGCVGIVLYIMSSLMARKGHRVFELFLFLSLCLISYATGNYPMTVRTMFICYIAKIYILDFMFIQMTNTATTDL